MDSSTNRKELFDFFRDDSEFEPVIPRFSGDIVETVRPGIAFHCGISKKTQEIRKWFGFSISSAKFKRIHISEITH
jgi:hypothetical protein